MKDTIGFDHGTPPLAVTQHQQRVQSMLERKPQPAVTMQQHTPAESLPPAQPSVVPPVPSPVPQRKASEKVKLTALGENGDTPAFSVSFQVGEVCYRRNYISLLIESDFSLEPSKVMKFELEHRGQKHRVVFLGGEFEFQTLGIRGISFLVDNKTSA